MAGGMACCRSPPTVTGLPAQAGCGSRGVHMGTKLGGARTGASALQRVGQGIRADPSSQQAAARPPQEPTRHVKRMCALLQFTGPRIN